MAGPKSQTEFDHSRTPFTTPAPRYTYLQHESAGQLKVNSDSLMVVPFGQKPYPGYPLRLPQALMEVDQPYVSTCGKPTEDTRGCEAAVGGGCPLLQKYGRIGPVNIIVEKDGKVDSAPCYTVYCGVATSGRPTSQVY